MGNNDYIGTREAALLTGLTQQTIRKRCLLGFYKTANQDEKGCPWRISKKEVLEKLNRR